MYFQTTTTKGPLGQTLIKNKHTNEPIAYIKDRGTKSKETAWHPDYLVAHPEIGDSLLHRNIHTIWHKSNDNAKNFVDNTANNIANDNFRKDPVKTKYAGEEKFTDSYGDEKTGHKYNMFDEDDNHIGHLISHYSPDQINPNASVQAHINKDYLSHHNVSDDVLDVAKSKHPNGDLESTMNRIKYILDNRNKEPRFIGTETAPKSKTEVYKHKMSPEDASSAYEEALKKNLGDSFKFTRHSPTAFVAHEPPGTSKYSEHKSHTVMSLPGEIHHTTYSLSHPDYDHKNKNTNVVESV